MFKNTLKEFKEFALKGNLIDMAVGIVIGGGFGKLVTSLVNDILMPPLGMLLGNVDFNDLKIILQKASVDVTGVAIPEVSFKYGSFIQTLIDFLIIAFSIFVVIKGINRLNHLKKKDSIPPPQAPYEPTKEEQLLIEIRDLLKKE